MAKKRGGGIQNTSTVETRSFNKGMIKDINEGLMTEGAYLNARNAVNNTRAGDLGVIGNEQSNEFCTQAPYTVIGSIHLYGDIWAIFSTDDTDSEIGMFDESLCTYDTVANDQCLAFKKTSLIIGEAKENFDCTWQVYWADGLNPDRTLNIDNPAFIQDCQVIDDCRICTDTEDLDCEALRMARLTIQPCVRLEAGPSGGELLNGTYQVVIAYTENEQRVSDYSIPTNIVSLFDHRNVNGSLDIIIEDIDQTYDEFELVVIGFVNQNLVARRIGIYSTHQNRISLDTIDPERPAVPIQFIPLDRPAYEKSEGIYRNGDFLIRVAPTGRFSFNYQPLANNIVTEWVSVEYPADYYRKAGVNVGYLRDEVYSFFIRWIYNTNDKSESYHIPGRIANPGETTPVPSPVYGTEFSFEANNTASGVPATGTTADGGNIVAKGSMGYWESSEIYPDNKPDVWDTLCGKPIRHHKMPDNAIDNHFNETNKNIRVLGVQFSSIPFPEDNQGNPIPGIVGYEILRGSREGNKTVIAKGLLNNMGSYEREDNGEIAYYQNYPYNDLNFDPFLSTSFLGAISDVGNNSGNALGGPRYQRDKFTFHSPDTQFKHPFLSAQELKVYETLHGTPDGKFVESYMHPKHKLITDFTFILGALVGFGVAVVALKGETKRRTEFPSMDTSGFLFAGPAGAGQDTVQTAINNAVLLPAYAGYGVASGITLTAGADEFGVLTGLAGDTSPTNIARTTLNTAGRFLPGVNASSYYEWDAEGTSGLPRVLRILQGIPTFMAYWGEATDAFLSVIKAFSKYHQHGAAYQSHCFHDQKNLVHAGVRAGIDDASYIGDRLQEFGGITVNNLFRNGCVALTTNVTIPDPAVVDGSRVKMSDSGAFGTVNEDFLGVEFNSPQASAHYTGLKSRLRNQYGQVDGIQQIPTASCMQEYIIDPANPSGATSEVIFGGDVYIGRYTEKNTFFYFFDWMFDQPDGFEYDYRLRKMLPFPTYWMDTRDFQINDFFTGIFALFGGAASAPLPSGFHNLDRPPFASGGGLLNNVFNPPLVVKDALMYLFNSGVRDFYVESEVNVEYRDWGDEESERHYDPYLHTDISGLFRTDIIKDNNFYKYDYSLSASRYYQGYPSWGAMQFRNYDPNIAETCYTFYPNRLIYSLPQEKELRHDNWLLYLVNNFKDFTSRVTTIKPIAKNGAMMLFETESPIQFIGVDQLETTAGTKITLGDGGLFSQPLQNLVNADQSYEYGSCQNRLSVINTPAGLFWISQNQGKIFQYAGQLNDISQQGMKWWFEEFLPYKIIEDFPAFELTDNTVVGVGCQSIYDNSNGTVYFTKRDFKLRPEWIGQVTYIGEDNFQIRSAVIKLGDPRYFSNASWTVSYDPKIKAWISFHDWHPNFLLPSKNNFMSIQDSAIWKHNTRSDSYCNFYGQDFPFEIDLVTPTGQTVNTLKSIEYLMEVYTWDQDEVDRFHVLDFNFDRAIVYNTEQISGELRLNLTPKNNAPLINTYPIVNPTSIDILYSKEEQKYRFNQFWDIVDDRGEFSTAARNLWNTEENGYIRSINQLAVNYNKPLHQRKKFRHYQSNLKLIRRVSGAHNIQLKLINSKNQYSMR